MKEGKLTDIDGVSIGNLMVDLNAGRKVFGEKINHDVSMQWYPYPNQLIKEGDVICKIYHPDFVKSEDGSVTYKSDNNYRATATKRVLNALHYSSDPSFNYEHPLVYQIVWKHEFWLYFHIRIMIMNTLVIFIHHTLLSQFEKTYIWNLFNQLLLKNFKITVRKINT